MVIVDIRTWIWKVYKYSFESGESESPKPHHASHAYKVITTPSAEKKAVWRVSQNGGVDHLQLTSNTTAPALCTDAVTTR